MILLPWYSRGIDFSNPKKKGRFKRIMLDTARLQEFYMDGSRLNDMAREFKVSKATVVRHLKFLIPDFLKKNRGRTGNLKAPFNKEIIKLYTNDHMSTSQIGRLMQCSDEKVRRHLLKCGVEMRNTGFKNPLLYHPKSLNRKTGKTYPIGNLEEFNKKQSTWNQIPSFMGRKVAIAQGFRLCFPDELGGLPYTEEEHQVYDIESKEVSGKPEVKMPQEKQELPAPVTEEPVAEEPSLKVKRIVEIANLVGKLSEKLQKEFANKLGTEYSVESINELTIEQADEIIAKLKGVFKAKNEK